MTTLLPAALQRAEALRGTLRVPSDKSIAHRALICAALATGESRVSLRRPGADVLSSLTALRVLGARIESDGTDDDLALTVDGAGAGDAIGDLTGATADCGNSGTTMRLLAGAVASGSGTVTLIGDESLGRRPMQRVAEPLRQMGAEIDLLNGHAPAIVRGRRPLRAMDHTLSVASAQVVGAIALAALAAEGTTTIRVPGITRDHTERMLSAIGAHIARTTDSAGTTTAVAGPTALRSLDIDVPGDFSSASAWIVAGALHADAGIRITGVGLNPTRIALVDVLRSMGARIATTLTGDRAGEPVGDIDVRGGASLSAVTIGPDDVAALIDELPLLAVAMAAADGTSEVRGASELRVKESDRIAAMTAALRAAGANVDELADGWRISSGRPRDARVRTHGDHRVAMAMAVAAWTGVASSVELDDRSCVAISYPSFWDDAHQIGAMA